MKEPLWPQKTDGSAELSEVVSGRALGHRGLFQRLEGRLEPRARCKLFPPGAAFEGALAALSAL